MREIKYRGKDFDTDEWLYGSLVQPHPGKTEAIWHLVEGVGNQIHMIKPGTSGQYTGLKDKNGKEIYEGDIVKFNDFDSLRTGGHTEDKILQGNISFTCGAWMVKTERGHHDLYTAFVNDEEIEVIGNIHDNPGLLEVKK